MLYSSHTNSVRGKPVVEFLAGVVVGVLLVAAAVSAFLHIATREDAERDE